MDKDDNFGKNHVGDPTCGLLNSVKWFHFKENYVLHYKYFRHLNEFNASLHYPLCHQASQIPSLAQILAELAYLSILFILQFISCASSEE